MAIRIKFTSSDSNEDYLEVKEHPDGGFVDVFGFCNSTEISFCFDISTAIKLSKSIRTEINKAKL